MRTIGLVCAWALVGCNGIAECGSTQGFISGVVSGSRGAAVIVAVPDDGSAQQTAEVDPDGTYEINLEGGVRWTLFAQDGEGCTSRDRSFALDACEEFDQDFEIRSEDCVTADKPNLYLYPDQDTPTRVTIDHDPRQEIFASDPPYRDGWQGIAHVDGTFTPDGGERAPFLFYEITLLPGHLDGLQREAVHCVDAGGAVAAMAALLGDYGFTAREQADFVDGWRNDLPPAERYAVYPQRSVDHAAAVSIEPGLPLSRLWLLVEPDPACVATAPVPRPLDRTGAHAVEWGVVLRGF